MLSEDSGNLLETKYQVNGFRSLENFSIILKPGLNVLVGPNGSGKTNFLDFLAFIDITTRNGATAAVSSLGGVSRTFSAEQLRKRSYPLITAKISSIGDLAGFSGDDVEGIFLFDYEIDVKFSKKESSLFISREILTLRQLKSKNNNCHPHRKVGSITLTRKGGLQRRIQIY